MRFGDELGMGAPGGLFSGGGASPSTRAEAAVDVAFGCMGAGALLVGGIAAIPAGGVGVLGVTNGVIGAGGCLVSAMMLGLASDRDLQAFGNLTGLFSFNGLVLGAYGAMFGGEAGLAVGSRIGNLADSVFNFSAEFRASSYERARDLWVGGLNMMGGVGQMQRGTSDMIRAFEAWGERQGYGGAADARAEGGRREGSDHLDRATEGVFTGGFDWGLGDRGGGGGNDGGGNDSGGDGGWFGGFFGGGGGGDKGLAMPGSGDARPVLY